MNQSSPNVGGKWRQGLALLLLAFPVSCAGGEDGHPSTYQYDATSMTKADTLDRCATPNEGCSCTTPGEILDCGKITVKVGNYETCYPGSRICTEDATWGPCVSDQAIVQMAP